MRPARPSIALARIALEDLHAHDRRRRRAGRRARDAAGGDLRLCRATGESRACRRRRWRGSRRGSPKAARPPTRTRGRSTAASSAGLQAATAMSSSRAGRSAWLRCRPSRSASVLKALSGPGRIVTGTLVPDGWAAMNRCRFVALAVATALLRPGARRARRRPSPGRRRPAGLSSATCHMPERSFQALHFAWKDGTAVALAGNGGAASLGTALIMEGPRGLSRSAMIEEFRDLQATANLGATVSLMQGNLTAPRAEIRRCGAPVCAHARRSGVAGGSARRHGQEPRAVEPARRRAVPKRWRNGCSRAW